MYHCSNGVWATPFPGSKLSISTPYRLVNFRTGNQQA